MLARKAFEFARDIVSSHTYKLRMLDLEIVRSRIVFLEGDKEESKRVINRIRGKIESSARTQLRKTFEELLQVVGN